MTTPPTPHPPSSDPWWVIEANIGAAQPTYQVVQGASKPDASKVLTANGTTVKVTGPFATQAQAQATIPAGAATGPGGPAAPGVNPSPTQAFTDVATALTAFYDALTDGKLWRSVGWLLLGVAMIITGMFLWIGPKSMPVPVPL